MAAHKECDLEAPVSISYSGKNIELVKKIQGRLEENGINCFVRDDITLGTPTLGAIGNSISTSRAYLFLVTPEALKSSRFAFETILTLERSQQLGQLNCVILLHGVTEEQLPQFALLQMLDKYELSLDKDGNWKDEQVQQIIRTIQEPKTITTELPVGNVAHAQAWSHYFGYHHVIHPHLAGKIRDSRWYKENNTNMPIAVYELVPKSCDIPSEINATNMKKVGELEPIKVTLAGNVKRTYKLSVYCIEGGGEEYHCVVQYPNVLSAIRKMELSPAIDMDERHKTLQVARFYYTLHAILQNSDVTGCRDQARLLWLDDTVEDITKVVLDAVKSDVHDQRTSFDKTVQDMRKILTALEEEDMQEKEFDAAILYNSDDQVSDAIETYLQTKGVRLYPSQSGTQFGSLKEAVEKVRWLILIITQNSLPVHDVFTIQTMSILQDCVDRKKVRIIPVTDNISNIPDLLKWVTYIDMETPGYEQRVYQALKGEDIPLALNAMHIPAGNIGYGLAWGYIVNYLKQVLPQFGKRLQDVLRSKEKNIEVCPEKLYLFVPKTCNCPKKIEARQVQHVSSFASLNDYQGGANIIKSLDIYGILDDNNIKTKMHHFIGQYPAPLRCLSEMNICRIAGINPESMKRERERFCDTLQSLLRGAVGEGLHNKCELVFFNDDDPDDLQRQLLPKIYFDVDREKSQRKRKADRLRRERALKQPKM